MAVRRPRRRDSTAESRNAAIGAMRAARRAGSSAATNVTITPSAMEITKVEPFTTRSDVGTSKPNAPITARNPMARPRPNPTPTSDASNPTSNASPSTEPRTCRPEAPSARSSASSRVRWAMTIENVLTMMNEPTNRAMIAKISRNVVKKPRPCSIWFCCSLISLSPVITWTPRSIDRRLDLTDQLLPGSTPGFAATAMPSSWPGVPLTRCASASVNSATVAPAGRSASPNFATPTILNRSLGTLALLKLIVTESPTRKCSALAVPRSMTTSPAAVGGRDCSPRYGDERERVESAHRVPVEPERRRALSGIADALALPVQELRALDVDLTLGRRRTGDRLHLSGRASRGCGRAGRVRTGPSRRSRCARRRRCRRRRSRRASRTSS